MLQLLPPCTGLCPTINTIPSTNEKEDLKGILKAQAICFFVCLFTNSHSPSPPKESEWANNSVSSCIKRFVTHYYFSKNVTADMPYLISLLIASSCSWSIMAKVWASAWPLGDSRSTELNIVSLSSSPSDTSTSLSNACATFANTLACWARSQSCSFRVWTC